MPSLNGQEFIARLKELRHDLPVVLCSGYLECGQEAQLYQEEVHEVLGKPFSRDELAWALGRALA